MISAPTRMTACAATRIFISTVEEATVNKDQVKGNVKEIKGNVKEAAGNLVGNDKLKAKGQIDQAAGKAQSAYGDLKEALEDKK